MVSIAARVDVLIAEGAVAQSVRAGQQEQPHGDQVCDSQRKHVALLQEGKQDRFLRNWGLPIITYSE